VVDCVDQPELDLCRRPDVVDRLPAGEGEVGIRGEERRDLLLRAGGAM
jgi:hypothetical protein